MIPNLDLRNDLANVIKNNFDGGTLTILTSADVVLGVIALPNPAFDVASGGAVDKVGIWSTNAIGTGKAEKAFFSNLSGKTGLVTISESGGGGDLIINNEDIVDGLPIVVILYTCTMPSS